MNGHLVTKAKIAANATERHMKDADVTKFIISEFERASKGKNTVG